MSNLEGEASKGINKQRKRENRNVIRKSLANDEWIIDGKSERESYIQLLKIV